MYELSLSTIIDGNVSKPHNIYPDATKLSGSEMFRLLPEITVRRAEHYYSLYKLDNDELPIHIADRSTAAHALDLYSLLSGVRNPISFFKDKIYQLLPDSLITTSDIMIVWEWVLENKDVYPVLIKWFALHGTCEMRDRIAEDTTRIVTTLDQLDKTVFANKEITALVPYDWELMPTLLDQYYKYPSANDTQLSMLFSAALSKLHQHTTCFVRNTL